MLALPGLYLTCGMLVSVAPEIAFEFSCFLLTYSFVFCSLNSAIDATILACNNNAPDSSFSPKSLNFLDVLHRVQ